MRELLGSIYRETLFARRSPASEILQLQLRPQFECGSVALNRDSQSGKKTIESLSRLNIYLYRPSGLPLAASAGCQCSELRITTRVTRDERGLPTCCPGPTGGGRTGRTGWLHGRLDLLLHSASQDRNDQRCHCNGVDDCIAGIPRSCTSPRAEKHRSLASTGCQTRQSPISAALE